MSFDVSERRKAVRYDFPSTIEFNMGTESGEKNRKAVTINISKSGLCLYLFESLWRHDEIQLSSMLPMASKKASVRWIKKIDEGVFKAGVSFM
jgi:hypothetical protein